MNKQTYLQGKSGKLQSLTYSKMAGVGLFSLLLSASPQVALAHNMSHADAVSIAQQTAQIKGTVLEQFWYGHHRCYRCCKRNNQRGCD